jgi:hypothetical protein
LAAGGDGGVGVVGGREVPAADCALKGVQPRVGRLALDREVAGTAEGLCGVRCADAGMTADTGLSLQLVAVAECGCTAAAPAHITVLPVLCRLHDFDVARYQEVSLVLVYLHPTHGEHIEPYLRSRMMRLLGGRTSL